MKTAWFDCFSGAAGDMLTAALLHAGLNKDDLLCSIQTMKIEGLDIRTEKAKRAGIDALRFEPLFPPQHHHRHLKDIVKIIEQSQISPKAKQNAIAVFQILANAEAAVHGTTPDKIHFHEVGALDSITDIVSFCVGIELLQIENVRASSLSVGGGTVQCDHGTMPVPAPATAKILETFAIPFKGGPIEKELLTPTAAAILAHFVKQFGPAPAMQIETSGFGAGTLDSKHIANVTRVLIGNAENETSSQLKTTDDSEQDNVTCLETNIDDATGETIGYVTALLMENNALDTWTTPIYMKHNRPAVMLSVLCENKDAADLKRILFKEGVTLGIRYREYKREKLKREIKTTETQWGPVRMKVGIFEGKTLFKKPEYADCAKIAREKNLPVEQVRDEVFRRYERENLKN